MKDRDPTKTREGRNEDHSWGVLKTRTESDTKTLEDIAEEMLAPGFIERMISTSSVYRETENFLLNGASPEEKELFLEELPALLHALEALDEKYLPTELKVMTTNKRRFDLGAVFVVGEMYLADLLTPAKVETLLSSSLTPHIELGAWLKRPSGQMYELSIKEAVGIGIAKSFIERGYHVDRKRILGDLDGEVIFEPRVSIEGPESEHCH